MKKFLLSLLAAIIAVGTAMAADQVFTWTYNTKTVSITGNLKTEGTIVLTGTEGEAETTTTTAKDVTFAFMADKNCVVGKYGNAPKGIALGGKVSNKAYFADLVSLTTADFKGQLIKGISFTQKFNNASSSNKIIIKIDGTQVYEIAGTTTASAVKYENADGVLCNENITIEYHFPENNSTVIGYFSEPISITYSEKTGSVDANPKFENIDIVYNPNEPNLKPVVTTPANFLADCANLTYTINQAKVIDCTDKDNLKILAPVEGATMTAAWGANDKYNEGSTTFTVTVKKNQNPGLAYSATTATATIGEKYELPTLTNDFNLPVTYSSSRPDFAEINEEGGVTLKAAGETVIKATFIDNELIAGGEASYTLTVNAEKPLEAPTFNLVDGGSYDYGMELEIRTNADGATLEYSTDAENYLPYTGPITLDKAGEWTVTARVIKGTQTKMSTINFTVRKQTYDYTFADKTLELGTNRYFEAPKVVDADGNAVEGVVYSLVEPIDETVLKTVPGTDPKKYFIMGLGQVKVKATLAGNDTYADFAKEATVQVVEQVPIKTTTATLDFAKPGEMGFGVPTSSGTGIDIDTENYSKDNITISFTATGMAARIWNYNSTCELRMYSGNTWTISAPNNATIESVEMWFFAGGSDANSLTATNGTAQIGNFTKTEDKNTPRTWSPNGIKTNSIVFKSSGKPRVLNVIIKYSQEAEPAKPLTLGLAEDYVFEVGESFPAVSGIPADFDTSKLVYMVNGSPIEGGIADFKFNEEQVTNVGELAVYTVGTDAYLPAVATAKLKVLDYELADVLAIHYSTENSPVHYSTVAYSAPKTIDNTTYRYDFTDIDVKGYHGVDGKQYGHIFFSFTPAPAEGAALAPRREAAEDDWASFNANTDIYSAATDLVEAGENTPLVRHRAGTLGAERPAVFRVQSAAETGKMYNFTVNLDKNGTSTVTATQSQTQTGVESVGVDADGEAEYYTLQGVRVAKPAAGIYLRRCAGTVSKVLVK